VQVLAISPTVLQYRNCIMFSTKSTRSSYSEYAHLQESAYLGLSQGFSELSKYFHHDGKIVR